MSLTYQPNGENIILSIQKKMNKVVAVHDKA